MARKEKRQVCYKLQTDDSVAYIMPTEKIILQYKNGRCVLIHNFFNKKHKPFDNFVRSVLRRKCINSSQILTMAANHDIHHFDSETATRSVAAIEASGDYKNISFGHWAEKRS